MRFVFEKTVLRVDGCLLSAADGVAVAAACPAVGFSHLEFSFDQDITLTAFSQDIHRDLSGDFSVACDPLAHVGLCISLLGQGFAQRNWQELMSCRLSFSVCGTTVLPRSVRKPEEPRPYTLYKAEKFAAARRSRRQEVLRL